MGLRRRLDIHKTTICRQQKVAKFYTDTLDKWGKSCNDVAQRLSPGGAPPFQRGKRAVGCLWLYCTEIGIKWILMSPRAYELLEKKEDSKIHFWSYGCV